MNRLSGLMIVCVAGAAVAGDGTDPMLEEFQEGNTRHVAHIYYNVGTGERISTLIEGAEDFYDRSVEQSSEIWGDGGDRVVWG